MGASRKLQTEMERVLKKVNEGILEFSSIWDKLHKTDNEHIKDKLETDLKKEIKKLQRFREQIKTWQQSSEIKDRKVDLSYEGSLMEARKQIESEMERFKICEKEMKTKAFSKEGLGQQSRTDPKEKAKSKTRDWLNNVVTDMENQIDNFEAELERIPRKKGKTKNPRLVHLETSISRHKAHIKKLELVLRLLDNDELSPYQVNDTKYYIEDYIEHNQSEFERFGDIDELYASLPLDMIDALEDTLGAPGFIKLAAFPPSNDQERCDEVNPEDKMAHIIPKETKTAGSVSAVICSKPAAVSMLLSSQSSNVANEKGNNITSRNRSTRLVPVQESSVLMPSSQSSNLVNEEGNNITSSNTSTWPVSVQESSVSMPSSSQPSNLANEKDNITSKNTSNRPVSVQESPVSPVPFESEYCKDITSATGVTDKTESSSVIYDSFLTGQMTSQHNSVIKDSTMLSDARIKTFPPSITSSQCQSQGQVACQIQYENPIPQLCSQNPMISTATIDASFSKPDEQLQSLCADRNVKPLQDFPDSIIKSRDDLKTKIEVTGSATEVDKLQKDEDLLSSSRGHSHNNDAYRGRLQLLEAAMLRLPETHDREQYVMKQHAQIPSSYPDSEFFLFRSAIFWNKLRTAKCFEILFFAYHFQQDTYLHRMADTELKRLGCLCSDEYCRWFNLPNPEIKTYLQNPDIRTDH